jgi:hypothetical protein
MRTSVNFTNPGLAPGALLDSFLRRGIVRAVASDRKEVAVMDERERMERYLAWRRAEGKDRRGRRYRRLRIAGILAGLAVLAAGAALAIVGRPLTAKQTVASLPAERLPADKPVLYVPSASVPPDVPAAPRPGAVPSARSNTVPALPPRVASRQRVSDQHPAGSERWRVAGDGRR